MAKQYKHKYINSDKEVCDTCYKLIMKGTYNALSARNKQHPCAPCYPNVLNYPHSCSLQMLLYATESHKLKSITTELYNQWVEQNSMEYHTSNSKYAFKLWDDRLEAFKKDVISEEMATSNENLNTEFSHDLPAFVTNYKCPIHKAWKVRFDEGYTYTSIAESATAFMHDIFPPPSKGDGHKINLPLTYLTAQMLRDGHVILVNRVLESFCIGTIENIITMHFVNILGNPAYDLFHNIMAHDHACCLTDRQYNDYAKAIGVAVRRCSRWVDGSELTQENICHLSYWEMCLGRLTNKSDWEKEKRNRCDIKLPLKLPDYIGLATDETNKQFLQKLRPCLVEIFDQLLTKRHHNLSWAEFTEQRQLWVTGGSAGGEKVVIDGAARRIDKKVLFEKLKTEEMLEWLTSEPIIRAVASEKYEIGKPRAIYGASPQSFMILTYLTKDIEAALNSVEGFEDGLNDIQEIEALLTRMKAVAVPGVHTTMVDYADFNLQHTLDAQYMMFDVIQESMTKYNYHPDMILAAEWAKNAMLNQWVKFPYDKEYKRVIQGMFSGIRTTNLMNTVLNKAYYMTIDKIVQEEMNIHPEKILAIHKGDDVWISNHNLIYAIAIYMAMLCSNFVFMAAKQLLGLIGEFLRIRYWEDHMLGYLCRSIGSLIERPSQSTEVSTPAVMLQGLRSQVNVMYRRGLHIDACNLVWTVLERFWANIKHPEFNDVNIPRPIIRKSHTLHGLGLGPPKTLSVGGTATAAIPIMTPRLDNVAKAIPQYMTDDYMRYLSRTLQKPFRIKTITRYIHNNNITGAASNHEKFAALKKHANDLIVWKKSLPYETGIFRCKQAFDEYLDYGYEDRELTQLLNLMESRYKFDTKVVEASEIGVIFQAIHSSPFRDIATARRATGLSYIAAAEVCILENPDDSVRNRAFQSLSDLKRSLGYGIVVKILSRGGTVTNDFESIFHPVVLAWLNVRAMTMAVREATSIKVMSMDIWDEIIEQKTRLVISTAYKQGLLLRTAGY